MNNLLTIQLVFFLVWSEYAIFKVFSGRTGKASPLTNFRCVFIVPGFGIKGINKIAKDFITVSQDAQIEGVGPVRGNNFCKVWIEYSLSL